jgi:hypothetical protein
MYMWMCNKCITLRQNCKFQSHLQMSEAWQAGQGGGKEPFVGHGLRTP